MSKITVEDILFWMPIVAHRGFYIRPDGQIRDRDDRCPLCALANEIDESIVEINCAGEAFSKLNTKHRERIEMMIEITRASDNALEDDPKIRQQLIEILCPQSN